MKLYPKNSKSVAEIRKFVVIVYLVGIIGFVIPLTRELFKFLTPYILLVSVYLLAIYHKGWSKKELSLFLVIYMAGFLIEALGVNTGIVFGHYSYGKGLGLKILNTPVIIGINWLFLSYTCVSVSNYLVKSPTIRFLMAPALMLALDSALEQVAPVLDMWSWSHGQVPVRNYIAWLLLATLFTALIRVFKINTRNPLSIILLGSQFLFFIALIVIYHIAQ